VGLPERDFWPRMPNPQVAPWPAAIPRPLRFLGRLLPGAGARLPSTPCCGSVAGNELLLCFCAPSLLDNAIQRSKKCANSTRRNSTARCHSSGEVVPESRKSFHLALGKLADGGVRGEGSALLPVEHLCSIMTLRQ